MRLLELFTTTQKQTPVRAKFDKKNIVRGSRKHEGGVQAYAVPNDRDPHEISLRYREPLEKNISLLADPKYAWAQTAIKYATDNPFFPRIYVVNVKTDSGGRKLPRYRMEKLQHLRVLPSETLTGMYENLFGKEYPYNTDKEDSSMDIAEDIAQKLERAVDTRDLSEIDNTQLRQALKHIIDLLKNDKNFITDIHANNVMVRGTPFGPQLVITDPLYIADDLNGPSTW